MNKYKYLPIITLIVSTTLAGMNNPEFQIDELHHNPKLVELNGGWTKTEYQRDGITTHIVAQHSINLDEHFSSNYNNPFVGRKSLCYYNQKDRHFKHYITIAECNLTPDELDLIWNKLFVTRIRNLTKK